MLDSAVAGAYPRRFWVVSLLDLLHFAANDWNEIIRDLRRLGQLVQPDINVFKAIADGNRALIIEPLERIAASCGALGLTMTEAYARRLIATVKDTPSLSESLAAFSANPLKPKISVGDALSPTHFEAEIAILQGRLDDELGSREFFALPPGRRGYFSTPNLFGEEVAAAFPSATVDIEEAGKCFALGRYTACVFHLMRAMEHGMRSLATYIGVPSDFGTWDKVIKKMRSEVENYNASSFKGNLDFVRQTLERLTAVQIALRNEIMHARSVYDEERADDIYRAVKTFMQQLATQLKATP